jgi:MFS family permease
VNHRGSSAPRLLFLVSALALVTAGLSFSLRLTLIGALQQDHLVALDAREAGELAGGLLGVSFLGFGLTLFLASSFLSVVGMGRALVLSGACFALGSGLVATGDQWLDGEALYRLYWVGFGLCGLGWGFMEATVNPLTAAAYPLDKTNRLNIVHAWWPAGIIAGGLGALGFEALGFSWEAQFALMLPPALCVIGLAASLRFPPTLRESAGIPMAEMFREILRRPMFLVWWGSMLLTSAAELAPGQWIDLALSRTVGMRGVLLLIYVSLMMFVLRHFAGPIARRISPLGMLWGSTVLAGIGLLALSRADSPATGLVAATIWGLGVCFLWPTMLANVSDRYPRGGEFFIGLMGVAGALAIAYVLPALGRIFDGAKIEAAGGEAAFAELSGAALETVLARASTLSFETLAIGPAILFFVFGAIWLFERRSIVASDSGRDAG